MFNMEFFEFFWLAFLGVLIHFLSMIKESYEKNEQIKWIPIIISLMISLIIIFVMVYSRSSFTDIYPLTYLTSVRLGYSSQSIFLKIAKMKMPKNNENENQ
jgi:hypothetical protein